MARFEVDGEQNRQSFRRRPIGSVEALIGKPRAQKADWIGAQPVELFRYSRLLGYTHTGLRHLGILYHTIDFDGSSFGRGLHHRYLELLPIEPTKDSFDRNPITTMEGVQTILSAELRVDFLLEEFPDKDIQVSGGISMWEGPKLAENPYYHGPGIHGDEPLPPRQLALAHFTAEQEGIEAIPIHPAPVDVAPDLAAAA